MARPKRPPVHGTVTQNRYLQLRLESQKIELLARDAAGAEIEQLLNYFEQSEGLSVPRDLLRKTLDTWKEELNAT